jgi:hypothetical protein
MSLKAFHIFFVAVSVLLAFGFAVWAFVDFAETKSVLDLVWGALGLASGVGLIYYGKFVLKKLKDFPYL